MISNTTKIGFRTTSQTLRQTLIQADAPAAPACSPSEHNPASSSPPAETPDRAETCRPRRRRRRLRYGTGPRASANRLATINWDDKSPLQLPLHWRVPLLKLDTVMAARGEHPYDIDTHVEKGVLRWVFNLAINPAAKGRDLRFWGREVSLFAANQIEEHTALRALGVQFAIGKLIGARQEFRTGDVCLILGIRRPALALLRAELFGEGERHVPRQKLEQFLIRRLVK